MAFFLIEVAEAGLFSVSLIFSILDRNTTPLPGIEERPHILACILMNGSVFWFCEDVTEEGEVSKTYLHRSPRERKREK